MASEAQCLSLQTESPPLSTHPDLKLMLGSRYGQQPSTPSTHCFGGSWSVQMCMLVLTHEVPRWGESGS